MMKNKKSLMKFISTTFMLILSFNFITYHVIKGNSMGIDEKIMMHIKPLETNISTYIMKLFSFIGSTIPVIIISLILLIIIYLLYKKRQEVYLFMVVLVGSTAINQLVKFIIKRERPISHLVIESGYSYPSGHTMAAVSLYGIITFLFWRHIPSSRGRIALILFSIFMILTIAFSRVYLHVHYPSDLIGAALLSGIWLYVTIWVFQFKMER